MKELSNPFLLHGYVDPVYFCDRKQETKDVISALKTQLPKHFETGEGGKGFVIEPNKLPESKKRDGMTKSDILKMPYAERNQFYKENPDAYKEIMNS